MDTNTDRLRAAYEAYGRGDLDGAAADWTDDVVWHIEGSSPIAGDRQGRQAITEFLGELMTMSNLTFKSEPVRFFADDDWGVAICHESATIGGQALDGLSVHLHRIVDTKVTESWFLSQTPLEDDAAMNAAFALIAAKA